MSTPFILTLNTGSSSIKIGLFRIEGGQAAHIGRGMLDLQKKPLTLSLHAPGVDEEVEIQAPLTEDLHEVVDAMLGTLSAHFALGDCLGAAHRVVHGGTQFHAAILIDESKLAALDKLIPLAPLHEPQSLRLIRALRHLLPELRQTASFDTAFHSQQTGLVRRFALPRELHEAGIMRYGFHGLSYAYIARTLAQRHPALAAGRVIAAHLGNGASACAMLGGKSIDSSMSFSTLDGLVMGTRCGTLDAGVILHLLQQRGLSAHQVEDLLYHRSGLLGVSGISGDMRTLEQSGEPAAREALEMFAFRAAGEISRLCNSVGGLDALVFTAGIGEHDAAMRAAICTHLGWLGVVIDTEANQRHAGVISTAGSKITVLVIPTDEEQTLADEALPLLKQGTS